MNPEGAFREKNKEFLYWIVSLKGIPQKKRVIQKFAIKGPQIFHWLGNS